MKGKATWKPVGLSAKKWREASQARGPANLLPPLKPPKKAAWPKKGRKQRPYKPSAS